MNPILDTMFGLAAATLVAVGVMTVLPRPKPEPPPPAPVELPLCDPAKEICPAITVRAEPETDAQRLARIEERVRLEAAEQKRLAQEVKALAVAKGAKDE